MPAIAAPVYPLSRDAFWKALHCGHGRAQIQADRYGVAEFRDEILQACSTSLVWDPQAEGQRAAWLAKLCESSDLVGDIIAASPSGSFWDRELRCQLLLEFALKGYARAREGLYDACERADDGNVHACDEIIQLDGSQGLAFVARTYGELLEADPEFWVDDEGLQVYDHLHGEGEGRQLLDRLADGDDAIKYYLQNVDRTLEGRHDNYAPPRRTIENVILAILSADELLFWPRGWARHARPEDMQRILDLALSDSEPVVIGNALQCLSGASQTSFHSDLFALLNHPDTHVRYWCARVLAEHVHPDVRAAGLEVLSFDVVAGLELLRANALAQDGPAMVRAIRPEADPDDQHAVVYSLTKLLRDSPVREPDLALYMYEYSPCMNCRWRAINALVAWGACPSWVLNEGLYDGSNEIAATCAAASESPSGAPEADATG